MTDDSADMLDEVLKRIDGEIRLDAAGGDLDEWSADLGEHVRLWLGDEKVVYAMHEWDKPGSTSMQRAQNIYSAAPGLSIFVLTTRYAMRVIAKKKVGTRQRPKIDAAHVARRQAITSLTVTPPNLQAPDWDDRHALLVDVEYDGIPGVVSIPSQFDREDMKGAAPKLVWALRDDYLGEHPSIATIATETPSDDR